MAYEFVEAFSSVPPKVRVTQILMILGIVIDIAWRLVTRNFVHPSFIDIPAALLVGLYLGKRPKQAKEQGEKKSGWTRIS